MPPGGSMGPGYVLQFLFSSKSLHCLELNNHQSQRKNKHRFIFLGILETINVLFTQFKNNDLFYHSKLAT
jgi:hypothetical protein